MEGYYVIFITVPKDKSQEVADFIVREKLGACVNIVEEVNSIYWWKGKIEKDKESLLIVKARAARFKELLYKVKAIHPYTVPEIIALPIVAGNPDYLRWIEEEA
ncbi:MAG: divalent-cation tolerance protein CutA [Synergistetes bacterium]|nr:divalent-cation tolerance protein CutA [Synergistota bacterium]MDW8191713.1 divalent-cation tolerance protein CutA [Synergistota bacterium]